MSQIILKAFYFPPLTNSITLCSILYNLQLLMLNLCATHPIQSHREEKKGKTKNTASKDLSIQTSIWSQFPWKPNAYTPLETFPTLFPWLLSQVFYILIAGRGWNSFSHNSPLLSDLNTSWQSSSPLQGVDWMAFQRSDPTWPQQATIFGSSLGLPQRSFCPVRVTLGLSPKFRQCAISLGLKEWKAKSWSPAPYVAMVARRNPIDPI